MAAPTWRRVGDEFEFTWTEHGVAATVEILDEDRTSVWGEIVFTTTEGGGHLLQRRTNLMAPRSQSELAKELTKRGRGVPWDIVLEQLSTIALREWRRPPDLVDLSQVEIPHGRPLFLDSAGIIPRGGVSVLYGPAESAKSIVALGLSAALGHMLPIGSIQPLDHVRTVYLDWEDTKVTAAARLAAIRKGWRVNPTSDVQYIPMEHSLPEAARWLRAKVAQHNIGLIVVDSYVLAVGQDPETSEAMQRLKRALRSLGPDVSALVLSHRSKTDLDKRDGTPYGSIMVRNIARTEWQATRSEDDDISAGTRTFQIQLRERKANWDVKKTLGLQVAITGKSMQFPDVVTFSSADPFDAPSLTEALPLRDRIVRLLLRRRQPMSIEDIAEELNSTPKVVDRTLRRMGNVVKVDSGEKGRGRKAMWALRSPREDPAP